MYMMPSHPIFGTLLTILPTQQIIDSKVDSAGDMMGMALVFGIVLIVVLFAVWLLAPREDD